MTKNYLRRTYGSATSVIRLVGAPTKMIAAAFVIKTALYWVISSEWHSEKVLVAEEVVVHSERELFSSSSSVFPGPGTRESAATTSETLVTFQTYPRLEGNCRAGKAARRTCPKIRNTEWIGIT